MKSPPKQGPQFATRFKFASINSHIEEDNVMQFEDKFGSRGFLRYRGYAGELLFSDREVALLFSPWEQGLARLPLRGEILPLVIPQRKMISA